MLLDLFNESMLRSVAGKKVRGQILTDYGMCFGTDEIEIQHETNKYSNWIRLLREGATKDLKSTLECVTLAKNGLDDASWKLDEAFMFRGLALERLAHRQRGAPFNNECET